MLIVVGGNRGGSEFMELWGDHVDVLIERHGHVDDTETIGVPDLRAVPGFLRGFVRGKFPDDRERWALLDWEGEFARAYPYEKGVCNLWFFDRRGRFRGAMTLTEFDPDASARIERLLARLWGAAPAVTGG